MTAGAAAAEASAKPDHEPAIMMTGQGSETVICGSLPSAIQ
jgi:hypothetical protein